MKNNIKYRLLFFILIVGLLIIFFILQMDNKALTFGDAGDYDAAAMSLLEEHQYPTSSSLLFFRAPFYPFFLFKIAKLFFQQRLHLFR